MASTTASHNKPVATRYARALLGLANKDGQAEPIREELNGLGEILDKSEGFAAVIADPGISESTRHALLTKAFGDGRVSPLMLNFLGLVNSKGRLRLLREIIEAYDDLLEAQLGNVEVDVTVAHRLSDDQLETVRQRVSTAIGRNAVVHQYVDESIIGGLVLRVQDKLIDASVKHQLETIRRQMLQAAAKTR